MEIINTIEKVRLRLAQIKSQGMSIALVPTLGNLHEGHLSLVKKAREMADYAVVSIYVNPLQFGPDEDFNRYPRTFERDCQLLDALQADMVFNPDSTLMYPQGKENHTRVTVDFFDGMHCGKSRPCFFTGVATVVLKLLNIITPDIAIFGEKDFQQLLIIKKMVSDLCLPVQIIGMPTVREPSGLALSSRNQYLDHEQKEKAAFLHHLLQDIASKIKKGERNYETLSHDGMTAMESNGFMPDYLNIVSRETLRAPEKNETKLIILAACILNTSRLIDNLQIEIDP